MLILQSVAGVAGPFGNASYRRSLSGRRCVMWAECHSAKLPLQFLSMQKYVYSFQSPSDWKTSDGNSVPFNSCNNNTSGSRAFSHVVTWFSRERTEFKFQLATLNINPHSSVGVRRPPDYQCWAVACESIGSARRDPVGLKPSPRSLTTLISNSWPQGLRAAKRRRV